MQRENYRNCRRFDHLSTWMQRENYRNCRQFHHLSTRMQREKIIEIVDGFITCRLECKEKIIEIVGGLITCPLEYKEKIIEIVGGLITCWYRKLLTVCRCNRSCCTLSIWCIGCPISNWTQLLHLRQYHGPIKLNLVFIAGIRARRWSALAWRHQFGCRIASKFYNLDLVLIFTLLY